MRIVARFVSALAAAAVGAGAACAQPSVGAILEGRAALVLKRPLKGEPLEGFSSITARPDATYWVMADTGHSFRRHREDVELVYHHVYIDWQTGRARLLSAVALRDPDRKLPFPIVNEYSRDRVLTSADLNIDGMHVLGYSAWFADDSGPYLVQSTTGGRLRALYPALVNGEVVRAAAARRGFGGLGATPDERFLYAAFEGPLWNAGNAGWESTSSGGEYARILEFDVQQHTWTGRSIQYVFDANGHTLADVSMIDAQSALVVERGDNFRRIYKVRFDFDRAVKLAYLDVATLPLGLVEGIALIDPRYIALTDGAKSELMLLRSPDLIGAGAP